MNPREASGAPAVGDTATRALGAVAARTRAWRPDPTVAVDRHVRSRPDTVAWGHLPDEAPPITVVAPGARVRVDTVSHLGLTAGVHPHRFFAELGVAADEVLDEVVAIHAQVRRDPGAGGHVLTGPIDVGGARPGDALEVRVVDAALRVPYGVNRGAPGAGVLPDLLDREELRLARLDAATQRLALASGVSVPVAPFPGIVAVRPAEHGTVGSRVPGRFGGNLDLRRLTAGSRLVLPVLRAGAGLAVGDPHSAQGDGECNGTAVEHSSSYTLDLVVHHGLAPRWPLLFTPTHLVGLGIDPSLEVATRGAVAASIDLLCGATDGALSVADAYAVCSIAGDLAVAEAVNVATVVSCAVAWDVLGR